MKPLLRLVSATTELGNTKLPWVACALMFVLCLFPFVDVASALPVPVTGSSGVSVELLPLPTHNNSLKRREHLIISDALAADLGIVVVPNSAINPQVRVVIDSPAVQGVISSANFTVVDTFSSVDMVIRLYRPLNGSDKNNGLYKLFVTSNAATVNFPMVDATVYPVTPSSTIINENGLDTTFVNFAESNGGTSKRFIEEVTVSNDKRAALLVPHGGNIEVKTSHMVTPVVDMWDSYSLQGDVWDARGTWGSQQTFKRWHVTSTALDAASHPGLEYLLQDQGFNADREFMYTLSLHGFDWSDKVGLIIGGRANTDTKCYILKMIQQRIENEYGDFKYQLSTHIFGVDGVDWAFEGADGFAPSDSDLAGLSRDNIVNRLSPNELGAFGFGGVQLELSDGLRDNDALRDIVAKGAAEAIAHMAIIGPKAKFCSML